MVFKYTWKFQESYINNYNTTFIVKIKIGVSMLSESPCVVSDAQ